MDITNKSLAFVLLLAIAVSITGTMISLNKMSELGVSGVTGRVSTSGETNLTINSSLACAFSIAQVDFGAGLVSGGRCEMTTNDTPTANCNGFNTAVEEFLINNTGNLNVTLRVISNATPAQFLAGSASPVFQWYAVNNETGSCASINASLGTDWNDTTTINSTLCPSTGFGFVDTADQIGLHILVNFSQSIDPGAHRATITAYCDNP